MRNVRTLANQINSDNGFLCKFRLLFTSAIADTEGRASANDPDISTTKEPDADKQQQRVKFVDLGLLMYRHSVNAENAKRRGVNQLTEYDHLIRKF